MVDTEDCGNSRRKCVGMCGFLRELMGRLQHPRLCKLGLLLWQIIGRIDWQDDYSGIMLLNGRYELNCLQF